jgi:hypothetical protein
MQKHYLIFLNIMRTSSFEFLLQENVPIAKLVGAGSLTLAIHFGP